MWVLGAVIDNAGRVERDRSSADALRIDQEAVRRMAQRDPDGLAQLYDHYSRAVYSFALHIVGEQAEAEDVVQEVFAQAWAQAPRYESSRGAVPAWLLTMTRSRAIDRLRTRRARPDSGSADEGQLQRLVDPGAPQDVGLFTRDQITRVRSAISRLPTMQRVVIEMAYLEGLSQRDIAERLDVPLGTIKTRARLALLKLREALTESAT
jgi:RNA polymerase sigma-70 factor (ECF subfamily)